MTDKRRMTVAVNLLITADIESEDGVNNVTIKAVTHNVMGSMLPIGDAPATTEEWREMMAGAAAKHGAQWLINELNGEHAEAPPPVLGMKGADA